jgi:hypothetical protein
MSFTVEAAAKEVAAVTVNDASAVAKAASNGSLRGARGNSGVILSQLFRGFAKGMDGQAVATTAALAQAFVQASETAYRAVMKPKEGTMLTIGREIGAKAAEIAPNVDDVIKFLKDIIKHSEDVLKRTPDMLPALKQAGVVDSGGKGIVEFFHGMMACAEAGFTVPTFSAAAKQTYSTQKEVFAAAHNVADMKFIYCTELLVHTENGKAESAEIPLKTYFDTLGDSIVVVGDDNIIKIHVHTDNPGLVLERARTYGDLDAIDINNMKFQASEMSGGAFETAGVLGRAQNGADNPDAPPKPFGVVTVAAGEGFRQLFADIGTDVIIEGGQTMNPSAEDIAEAVLKINADHIFVLPNNKNIIWAADQAKYLCEGKPMTVIPTKSMPQGIAAMLSFDADTETAEEITAVLNEAIERVHTGQVTVAVRDTVVDGIEIAEGDYLFIRNNNIEFSGKDLAGGMEKLFGQMITGETEFVTVYYGTDADEGTTEALRRTLAENYGHCEFEIHEGGQPVYMYLFSVE